MVAGEGAGDEVGALKDSVKFITEGHMTHCFEIPAFFTLIFFIS